MVLIIDSGGTKLEWRFVGSDGSIKQGKTAGFHPLFHDHQAITEIAATIANDLDELPATIHYYGAGYASAAHQQMIEGAFLINFPQAIMEINSDLLAVARALCGGEQGLACILGTGSNSCHYDGQVIVDQIPPLGYVLGDEGSGVALGKQLVKAFCRNTLPDHLRQAFAKKYGWETADIIDKVYAGDEPNKFLASFAPFILHHQGDPFMHQLIHRNFVHFIEEILLRYQAAKDLPIHFSGSIAFYYNGILREVMHEYQLTVGNIVESPIAGLTLFHGNVK